MSGQVVLCVDSESARRPELIGLSGERLDAQSWLSVFEDGATARTRLRECRARSEAWVVSSDDVDAINLAATLKRDAPVNSVYLVSFRRSGSLRSRASAAGLDGLLDFAQFAERYRACKRRSLAAGQENAGAKSARIMAVDASGGMEGGLPARSSAESHPGASGPMAPSADGTIGSGRLVPPSTPGPVAKPAPSNAAIPGRDRSSVPGADSEFLRGLDLGGNATRSRCHAASRVARFEARRERASAQRRRATCVRPGGRQRKRRLGKVDGRGALCCVRARSGTSRAFG